MPKHTHDYDNVFKTMKVKHKRLFISVINEAFNKQYPLDIEPEVLPSEGYFTEMETKDNSKDILSGKLESAIADLAYFKNAMTRLYERGELTYYEMTDLTEFVNTIITHITDGNKNEERLVSIMGGTILETASERFIRIGEERGQAKNIIEFAKEMSWSDDQILNRLQKKLNISLEKAMDYLKQFDNLSA